MASIALLKVRAAVADLLQAARSSDELKSDSKVGSARRQWVNEMRERSALPRPPIRPQTIDTFLDGHVRA
ncbi:hypothetical protein [Promicromonospora soli]|uniref:Uncharacterized protein n=1 Tax=Promicromonospora soli TaxID=2035533 RepID=A0A919G6J7_9MICO|nr:hypothetical protein [Promicromonospora soli]GHH78694.1 hypothetical protein GCM10017772_42580 [Promicromonospora soli]